VTSTSTAAPRAASPHRQRRKDARPHELLDAALALFVEKGFAATRAEEVAHRAGVSKGTLYLYFPSKEELLKAVIRHTLSADIAGGRERILAFEGSAAEALTELLSDWWERVYDSPNSAIFKLVLTEVRNFPEIADFYASEVVNPGMELISQLLQRGMDSGEFRRVDLCDAVYSLVLPMIMLCVHKHSLGACPMQQALMADPRRLIRSHMQLVLTGLRAGATAAQAAQPRIEG
jgi:AcrR family transcriptional regulator